MKTISTIDELDRLYAEPVPASLSKVMTHIVGDHARWIEASRFAVLTTVGPEGTDGSPRGDVGPVARILDPQTLAIPDWRGNNRLDSLRNIVRDGRVSLMFMVPGSSTIVRVNGTAVLTDEPDMTGRFEVKGRHPVTVIVVTVAEVYMQCAKAVLRSELWSGKEASSNLPSAGDLIAEASSGRDGGAGYDADYEARARDRMW